MINFKLGIRAVHQKNIRTAILEAKKNGFEILEIHLTSPQFLPERYTQSQLAEIKNFAEKNNIILQTHSEIGQSLVRAGSIIRKAEKQKLRKIIQFSQKIGARCLTLHIGEAPGYYSGPGQVSRNNDVYTKFYMNLLEDSLKNIIKIAPKDLYICIENDKLNVNYEKVLDKYLKAGKFFLTWDFMKTYSYQPTRKIRQDQLKFFKKNINSVRNVHISGPSHAGLTGYEKDFTPFLKLLKGKDISVILEILSLPEAIKAKVLIQNAIY